MKALRIGLVGCVKSKRGEPAAASDLYTSALFQKSRAWVLANCDGWFILSAKHGLLGPDAWVEPYEQTLNRMGASERRTWARRVLDQMREAGLLASGTSFVWLAGARYKVDLSRLLSAYEQEDPLSGLDFGNRLRWLTEHAPDGEGS